MAVLSEEDVFGPSTTPAPIAPRSPLQGLMSDDDVFGKPQSGLMSDADVFGTGGTTLAQHTVEFGKGLISAPPTLGGLALKGAASGARGFSREQIRVMNDIDSGLAVREVDDPIGYQHMMPEQRAAVRQQVEGTVAVPIQQTPIYRAGEAVQNILGDITKPAPGVTPGIVRDVGAGIGSTVSGIALGLVPGVGVPLAGAAFTLAGTGEAIDEAIKKGATPEQIERAGRWGTVAGATDVVDALLPTLGGPGKVAGLIKRVGTSALKSFFIEGGQEGLQQGIQNLIAQGIYDPNRDVLEGVPYNALVGALSGGIVGGGIGGLTPSPPATEASGMTPDQALASFAGEVPAAGAGPAIPTQVAATGSPSQLGQLDLPLGPPTLEPELPFTPPTASPGPVVAPATPKAAEPAPAPTELRADIADFLDALPEGSKGSPLVLPQGPIDLDKLLDERQRERIKSSPGANVGRLARILGPDIYGNLADMAGITVKEIVQNSFDALKTMAQRGQKEGNIDIITDENARTISVVDDGVGMTPEVLGKQFLEIAGTAKEGERSSGGLGIAKMQFLFGNKNLEVVTMRNGKVSQLSTTGETLFDALDNPSVAPDITIREPTSEDLALFPKGHGTAIRVQIPETFKNKSIGAPSPVWFSSVVGSAADIPVLTRSPLFENINVTFNGENVPIGSKFPIADYSPLTSVKFDWGAAQIYVSNQEFEENDYADNANVLSNGLWQFSFGIPKNPREPYGPRIGRLFYIDVNPRVKPEEGGYPFALSRQEFSKQTREDFQKIFNYISKIFQQDAFLLEVENFGDMQYVNFDPKTRSVTNSGAFTLKPPAPPKAKTSRGIQPGDKVVVRDGKLIVNGRRIPELTTKEIESFKIDTASMKIPQKQIKADQVIIHDNTSVSPTGAPLTDTSPRVSLTQLGVSKFGNRFYEYSFLMGHAFKQLRDVVVGYTDHVGRDYYKLREEGIGVSFDKAYRGVSIRIPFSGSFINPAVPVWPQDPVKAAIGMIATMVHELAHHHHRSEDGLAPIIQDLFTQLDADQHFNFQAYKQKVVNIVNTYHDILQYLSGVYSDGNVESRGRSFKTSSDQARDGSSLADDAGGPLGQSRKGSNLSEWVAVSETGAGQRAGRDDGSARAETSGGASGPDFGISANQRALDRETGKGVPAAPRHPATQAAFQAAKRGVNGSPPVGLSEAGAHADRINWFYEWMAGLLELAKANPRFTPLLQYAQNIQLMHREESAIQDAGVSINKEWRRLGRQSENLAAFLDDLTNMTYLTPDEVKRGVTRHPTPADMQALVKKHKMEPKTIQFAARLRKFFNDFLDLVSQSAKEDALRTIRDPVIQADKIDAINTQVANLKSRPYFPFMRFGNYFVTVRNAAGDVVWFETFERKGLLSAQRRQQRRMAELKKAYDSTHKIVDGVLPENAGPMVGMPSTLLQHMRERLGLTPQQIDALEQLTFEMSPSLSFKHRFQHKNYTPGYSKDFARAFARYVFYGARFYSRSKYSWRLQDNIAGAKAVGGRKADRIRNYMQDHLNNTVLDAKGDYGWLKGLAFLWHLGYSPAAAFTNLTQTPIFTWPYLASKFGDVSAGRAMARAMAQVNKTFRYRGHYQNLSDFEMRALGYGIKTGVVSETQAAELSAIGNSTNLLHGSAGNTLERAAIGLQQGASLLFELAEQANRRIAFRATLDLAMQKPNAPIVTEAVNRRQEEYGILTTKEGFSPAQAKAIITALHTVEETQVVYGRYARPRLFRGRIAGTVLIFERYMQAMIMQMVHNKGAAARQLLLMGLLGGLGGLPGYEDIMGIIKAVYQRMGFGSNPELELRKWIVQQFNGAVEPDIILHGFARRGFGIPTILDALGSLWTGQPGRGFEAAKPGQNVPAPVLDFSKSVGMGQLLPVQIGKLMQPQVDTDKVIAEQSQRATGAGFSIFFNIGRAIMDQKLELTDQKRWEKGVPREMGAISKAYRAYEEGRERTRSAGPAGASTLVNYDVRDTEQLMEIIAKGLGYNTLRESVKWDYIMAKKDAEAHVTMERNGIVEQFFEAWSGKDQKEIDTVKEAIDKFNKSVAGTEWRGYAISSDSLRQSVMGRQRERIGQESGVPTQRRQVPVAQEFQALFPEAKGVIDVRRVQ